MRTGDAHAWGRLLAYVACEKVTLSRAALLETFCSRAWNAGGASTLSPVERSALLRIARLDAAARQSSAEALPVGEDSVNCVTLKSLSCGCRRKLLMEPCP